MMKQTKINNSGSAKLQVNKLHKNALKKLASFRWGFVQNLKSSGAKEFMFYFRLFFYQNWVIDSCHTSQGTHRAFIDLHITPPILRFFVFENFQKWTEWYRKCIMIKYDSIFFLNSIKLYSNKNQARTLNPG